MCQTTPFQWCIVNCSLTVDRLEQAVGRRITSTTAPTVHYVSTKEVSNAIVEGRQRTRTKHVSDNAVPVVYSQLFTYSWQVGTSSGQEDNKHTNIAPTVHYVSTKEVSNAIVEGRQRTRTKRVSDNAVHVVFSPLFTNSWQVGTSSGQ